MPNNTSPSTGLMRPLRILSIVAALAVPFAVGMGTASAAPGHTSCKGLGTTTASEARTGTLVPEILSFTPGLVDDIVALAQVGGQFDDQTVLPLCTPK